MSRYKSESFVQILLYAIGFLFLFKAVFTPLAEPIKASTGVLNLESSFYENILWKSNAMVEVAMGQDNDEDNREILADVFKYITNIEISNPKTYIASQVPVLSLIDLSSLIDPGDDEPVVVEPPENNPQEENPELPDNPQPPIEEEPYKPPAEIDENKPLVLIYHSHTTEIYNPDKKYPQNFSTDINLGVAKVGAELEKELETKYGISTVHDTTIHDLPKRATAYSKSRPTLQNLLKKYPSVKLVIDLHRDGVDDAEKVTAVINNEKYARVMFVIGRGNKNSAANVALSTKLNNTFDKLYKGLSRGIKYSALKTSKYNQDVSPYCVLIEVGSERSSLQEAVNTSKLIARVIAENLK